MYGLGARGLETMSLNPARGARAEFMQDEKALGLSFGHGAPKQAMPNPALTLIRTLTTFSSSPLSFSDNP